MNKNPSESILMLLKMRGEATSLTIANELGLSKEGARKRLLNLVSEGLIASTDKKEGVGRPSTYYHLTKNGESRFPDSHADITIQLIRSVKKLLGDNALDLLISDRESTVYQKYAEETQHLNSIEDKLDKLSKIRTNEGYMAEWEKDNNSYYLIENHCPICAAATECQGFCRSELKNFKQLIGDEYNIERIEYMLDKGNRCVYKIEAKEL